MTRAHLVTFSDESMSRSRDLCIESAIRNGVDERNIDPWSDGDLVDLPDDEFLSKRPDDSRRALGWWSWKPAIIDRNLNGSWCDDGDILIYADAGIEFIAPVSHVINRMDQDIFLFGNNWEHAHWCKADVVDAVWPTTDKEFWKDDPLGWSRFGKQVQASVIFFRVSDWSRRFVKEWLGWCLASKTKYDTFTDDDGLPYSFPVSKHYLIDDSPSVIPNHPEFREHRHDQAILTTMAYREGIKLRWWPAMYNDGAFTYEKLPEYAGDDYPVLFHHHRKRNVDWKVAV